MEILLFKIILTCAVVLFITWVSETKGGFWGGVALGFPSAYAIILLFIGLSQPPEFTKNAIELAFLGFISLFVFELLWILVMRYWKWKPKVFAPIISIIPVFIINALLAQISFSFQDSIFIGVITVIIFHFLLKKIQPIDVQISKKELSKPELIFRVFLSSLIIIAVTEMTNFLGPAFSGMLTVFPTNLLVMLLILQRYNNDQQIATILKYHPLNMVHIFSFTLGFLALFSFLPFLMAWCLAFILPIITVSITFFLKK